ncbi:MAG: hypothetical protein OXG68_14725, partial [Chloroflexi bacterium]|nr:hypothetical protein [Chloroflexota bacterium]
MTATAIRATLDERRELTITDPSTTASPTDLAATATLSTAATKTEPPTIEIQPSATQIPMETVATAGPEVAPANLTLTAIRATLAERRELTIADPSTTASPTDLAATATLNTAATKTEPPTIEILPSATSLLTEVLETTRPEIAPANLTLTAIRATIAERRELTSVRPSPTASPIDIVASATPLPSETVATARLEIAPANVTLTAIRATLAERRELTAVRLSPTASPTDLAAAATTSTVATVTEPPTMEVLASATPLPTDVLETESPEIAPANLTLTAIRASIDERRELPAVRPSSTASPTDLAAAATPSATATETEPPTIQVRARVTPHPTEILVTAGPEIAPANVTLTAIRASIDERRELTAVDPSPTASPTDVAASATPVPTERVATAAPEIAPANLTLTAIRAAIEERRQLASVSPSPTAIPTDIFATATSSATSTETESPTMQVVASEPPMPTEDITTAGPEVAPANLTLTAIRA